MPLAADDGLLSSVAKGMVKSVTFRSQVTPDYTYDPWAPSPPPQEGSGWLMELVKPSVEVQTSAGPVLIEPYGTPTENYGPVVAVGALGALAAAVYAVWWVARATK